MPFVAALALAARLSYEPTLATAERRVEVMGTTLDLVVRMKYRDDALAASEAALAEIRRVEALLTTWKPGGELWRVNDGAPGKPVIVSPELAQLLATDLAWVPRTRGAFDPTIFPLIRAWDLRGKGRIPTSVELSAARKASGVDHFRVDVSAHAVTRLSADAGIDEGAWGKGYALELADRVLRKAGVAGAVLDLGGQVLAVGSDANERPWRIPVADPRDRQKTVAELGLANLSASTSGNSERGRVVDGRRVGHILDPRTGEPARGLRLGHRRRAVRARRRHPVDGLLRPRPRDGLALSAALRKEGVENEALFLVVRGAGLEAVSSPGIASLVLSADPRAVVGLTPQQP